MEQELEKDSGRDMTPRLIGGTYMKYPNERSSRKYRYGLYECQYCGKEFEAITSSIKIKNTVSCGCQRINKTGITHGLTQHRFYKTWNNIFKRCNNPKNKYYKNYGGRGITVCEEWLDVGNFVAWCDLTHPNIEGLSLDRIDNDKGYSPENCRWADRTTQNTNQRMKKNNTSGFVGVSWNRTHQVWVAYISVKSKRRSIGTFKIIEEAVQARDNYIIQNNLPHKLSTDYKREA